MSTIRLYTEEQVREALNAGFRLAMETDGGLNDYRELFINALTPIELPSGIVNIEIQYQYHSSIEFYVDAGFVDCTKEQYESIKQVIPNCPLNKIVKLTPIELPTDEEIREKSIGHSDYHSHQASFSYGAKWVINKILNK